MFVWEMREENAFNVQSFILTRALPEHMADYSKQCMIRHVLVLEALLQETTSLFHS